jgi:hypothetical protein
MKNWWWRMVLLMKETTFAFSQFVSPMLFFPNFPIASLNNEYHNLENKDLENDRLKGQPNFSCSKHCLYKFIQCYQVQWFQCFNQCITCVMGILPLPSCVNGTYEYITTWTKKHYVHQWMPCNVVPTIRTNDWSIFVNRPPHPFSYMFGHIHLGLF